MEQSQSEERRKEARNNDVKYRYSIFLIIWNLIVYGAITVVWLLLIFLILKYTGVLSYLSTFDKEFRYIQGYTPLTSRMTVVVLIGGYVISLPIFQSLMADKKPFQLRRFMVIHNFLLMTLSAILCIGIGYFVIKNVYYNGFYHSICSFGTFTLFA